MVWRVTLAVFFIAVIIVSGVLFWGHISNVCDDITGLLSDASGLARQGNLTDKEAFSSALDLWRRHMPFVSSLVIHDRVDAVTQAFARAEAFIDAEDQNEYLAALNEIIFCVNVIREYDKPTIRSIL